MKGPIRDLEELRLDEFRLDDFLHEFLVVCPRCSGPALVRHGEAVKEFMLACEKCGYSTDCLMSTRAVQRAGRFAKLFGRKWPLDVARSHTLIYGEPIDPHFHLPLWLQAPCAGQVLWAYNRFHLSWLEQFVETKIRNVTTGRAHRSLAHKLPRWLLSRKNRDEVLRSIARLQKK